MKHTKTLILILLASFAFSSCGEWLNLEPEDGVIRERYWKTKEEARAALNGCYASMMEDEMMLRFFIWGEVRADFTEPTARANTDVNALRDGEITSSNRYSDWGLFYRTINQCNTIIEFAPQAQKTDLSFSETLLKQYQAEAVCVRSLAYFYLLRTFRDVPYVTTAGVYDDQNYTIPKSLQADIVDSLIASLRAVENNLPFTYNTVLESKGHFTAWGLKTLLADIYLWKGDYQNTIDLCTQIINSQQFSLIPVKCEEIIVDKSASPTGNDEVTYHADKSSVANLFDQVYVQGNSAESIFELQFTSDKSNPFVQWFMPGSPMIQVNSNVSSEYFPTSSIDRGWTDIRGAGFAYSQVNIWKQVGLQADAPNSYRNQNESFCNWIFYRLADVILMKAEALTQQATNNNQDKLAEAYELVKQIRTRGNAPESTDLMFGQSGDLDAITMEEFILNERAREFAFEGKRWFDVLRHAQRNNYAERNLNYLIKLAIYSATPEKISVLQNKWKNSFGSHYLPININQIKANKKLIQNEFYQDNLVK
jgi:hypothetical protein